MSGWNMENRSLTQPCFYHILALHYCIHILLIDLNNVVYILHVRKGYSLLHGKTSVCWQTVILCDWMYLLICPSLICIAHIMAFFGLRNPSAREREDWMFFINTHRLGKCSVHRALERPVTDEEKLKPSQLSGKATIFPRVQCSTADLH